MKKKIAIVGHGFVGRAVDYGFTHPQVTKQIIDPKYGNSVEDIDEDTNYVFICVPTPMCDDGTIDSSILIKCFEHVQNMPLLDAIIIKSTVTPNIIENFHIEDSRVVYNPEFLTERSAQYDFINPIMHVFGGLIFYTEQVEWLYQEYSMCKPCQVFHMSVEEASFVKYGINSFLATKVLWFNQLYSAISNFGNDFNFNKVINVIGHDSRVGYSHTTVPGFDGKMGFGGSCFAKDTQAFLKFSEDNNFDFSVLREVIRSNNEIRKQYELDEREKEQNVSFGINV